MDAAFRWYLVLLVIVIVVPYATGLRPRTQRQWRAVTTTIAFLTWVLLMMGTVRA